MTLTLNFQGQIWNLLYFSQKLSDCHETKFKNIDWTLGPKCEHRILPWPWPWPWIFKVKYGVCYDSAKHGQITTKRKANISIDLKPWMCPSDLTLAMTLTLNFHIFKIKYEIKSKHIDWILGIKCNHWVWIWQWPWPWINKVKFSNSDISGIGGPLDIEQKGSFMTMAMTYWWPRWGIRTYPIVTGVTSDVGAQSNRLILSIFISIMYR